MKHEVKYDEINELVVITFKANYNYVDVEPLFKEINELLEGKPNREAIVVIDESINNSFQVENRETRELSAESLSNSKMKNVAFVGGTAAIRMIAKVLLKTGVIKVNGEFFKTFEEALKWIKNNR